MIDPITEYLLEKDSSITEYIATKDTPWWAMSGAANLGRLIRKGIDKYKYSQMNPAEKGIHQMQQHKGEIVAGIAVVALLALIIKASHMIYKRTMSQAAKSCRGREKGESQTKCLDRYRIKALETQIQGLKSDGLKACGSSKNPSKCKSKLEDKIKILNNTLERKKKKFQSKHGNK